MAKATTKKLTLAERFAALDDDDNYLKFERIPVAERLHPDQTLCGYLKVYSLVRNSRKFDLHGEHDIVYLASEYELKPLTDADIMYLRRCGIHWNENADCLADFC